ncbi:MAG: hypothetical protein HQ507_06880 [Candidatus Marinimicrobia bacterium]|nr:hypothetical protein [Candidatus Neomarinimicrobiota bacterium]
MSEKSDYVVAKVKCFGGYNHRKDRPNDFGFAEVAKGYSIILHEEKINHTEIVVGNLSLGNG